MREFVRLLYLIVVVLPLGLLLIGPSLTLAALRGRQRIGPITLNPGRRGAVGRVWALLLGLLVWLAVWGGLAVILSLVGLPAVSSISSYIPQARVTATVPAAVPTPSPTPPAPVASQIPATSTPIQPQAEEVVTPSPSPTPSPIQPTPTPGLPTPTATPVPPTPTPLPTATAVPALPDATLLPTTTPTPAPTPIGTLSLEEINEPIAAVEVANELLRAAVIQTSIGNLAAMEALWQEAALAKAQAFAQDLAERFLHPLEVTFVYLRPPVVLAGGSSDTAIVTSIEAWTYTGPLSSHSESFEFTYTLGRRDGRWVITNYIYLNAPGPLAPGETPTATP